MLLRLLAQTSFLPITSCRDLSRSTRPCFSLEFNMRVATIGSLFSSLNSSDFSSSRARKLSGFCQTGLLPITKDPFKVLRFSLKLLSSWVLLSNCKDCFSPLATSFSFAAGSFMLRLPIICRLDFEAVQRTPFFASNSFCNLSISLRSCLSLSFFGRGSTRLEGTAGLRGGMACWGILTALLLGGRTFFQSCLGGWTGLRVTGSTDSTTSSSLRQLSSSITSNLLKMAELLILSRLSFSPALSPSIHSFSPSIMTYPYSLDALLVCLRSVIGSVGSCSEVEEYDLVRVQSEQGRAVKERLDRQSSCADRLKTSSRWSLCFNLARVSSNPCPFLPPSSVVRLLFLLNPSYEAPLVLLINRSIFLLIVRSIIVSPPHPTPTPPYPCCTLPLHSIPKYIYRRSLIQFIMDKRKSEGKRRTRRNSRQTEEKQENEDQLLMQSGEQPIYPDLFNRCLNQNLEQRFPLGFTYPSRGPSSVHSNQPDSLSRSQHPLPPFNPISINGDDSEDNARQASEDCGPAIKQEEVPEEPMDCEYERVLNDFDQEKAIFQTLPQFFKQKNEKDNQLTKLLCFKPNRKNARSLRYDEDAKTIVSVYTCYGCGKEFLVSSALGGHLSKCREKAKHCEYIQERSNASRPKKQRSANPNPTNPQREEVNQEKMQELISLPIDPQISSAHGKSFLQMKQHDPSPMPCSEFTKILNNNDVKIEQQSPKYHDPRHEGKSKPMEKTTEKRHTRNTSKLTKRREEQREEHISAATSQKPQRDGRDISMMLDLGPEKGDLNQFLISREQPHSNCQFFPTDLQK